MARIRSVHPGLFTDEAFMQLTIEQPAAVALLIGLWCQADDAGHFEWKPLTLKARVLPAAPFDIAELLDALARLNFIRQFRIDGRLIGVIRNFVRFQRPKKPVDLYPFTDETRAYAGFDHGARPNAGTAARAAAGDAPRRDGEADEGVEAFAPELPLEAPAPDAIPPFNSPQYGTEAASSGLSSVLSPQREEEGGRRKEEGSEADASDARASPAPRIALVENPEYPADPTERLWAEGLDHMRAMGAPDRAARSVIGRALKLARGDPLRVLDAIRRAREHGTKDPIALVMRLLSPTAFNSANPQPNPEKSVHAAAKRLCDDVASGRVVFGPIPPSVGELLARDRQRERENRPRLLS